jgi:ATP-binding cassette subfamily B protein
MYGPLQELQDQLRDLQQAYASLVRVTELLATESSIADDGTRAAPQGGLEVAFENVTFTYAGTQDPVLRGVSFRIERGSRLGVIGKTGSGKTTLARLLCRLEDQQVGTIRLSGTDARQFSLSGLRERVALVPQDVQLLEGTLRDNITLFDPDVSDEDLMEIMERLGLSSWMHQRPSGLGAQIGSGGRGLSAGEAQLVALARVFLKDPGLVILDEASARVDPTTEARIHRATDNLLADRTGIVIAHRLNTLNAMDSILILEDGAVVEYGHRDALVSSDSRFARLLRLGTSEVLA